MASNNVWAFGPEVQGANILVNDSFPTNTNQKTLDSIKNSLIQEKQNVVTTKAKGSTRKSRVRNVPSNTALDQVANSKQKNDEL